MTAVILALLLLIAGAWYADHGHHLTRNGRSGR